MNIWKRNLGTCKWKSLDVNKLNYKLAWIYSTILSSVWFVKCIYLVQENGNISEASSVLQVLQTMQLRNLHSAYFCFFDSTRKMSTEILCVIKYLHEFTIQLCQKLSYLYIENTKELLVIKNQFSCTGCFQRRRFHSGQWMNYCIIFPENRTKFQYFSSLRKGLHRDCLI